MSWDNPVFPIDTKNSIGFFVQFFLSQPGLVGDSGPIMLLFQKLFSSIVPVLHYDYFRAIFRSLLSGKLYFDRCNVEMICMQTWGFLQLDTYIFVKWVMEFLTSEQKSTRILPKYIYIPIYSETKFNCATGVSNFQMRLQKEFELHCVWLSNFTKELENLLLRIAHFCRLIK